jgi:glycolate oxidase iron-sulfur subunit
VGDILAEIYEKLNTCGRCGFCHGACKTYKKDGAEFYVARGRVQLIKALADGKIDSDHDYENVINSCLLCGECAIACPSGVKTHELVLAARRDYKLKKGIRPFLKSLILSSMTKPGRLKFGFNFFDGFGKNAMRRLDGMQFFRGIDVYTMPSSSNPFVAQAPEVVSVSAPKKRVAFFVGCFMNYAFVSTAHSVVKVLTKAGCEVTIPREQPCCGLPQYVYGDFESARAQAKKTIATFGKYDTIVTACGSCASMLKKEMLELFQDDPSYLPTVKAFSAKVFEFSELVSTLGIEEKLHSDSPQIVTYHDPCHLVRYLKVTDQPRKLLKSVPRLQYNEMFEANRCCGAAGLVMVFYQELSTKITADKAANIINSGAETVATSCPACMLKINSGLKLKGSKVPVKHVADVLAEALRD